jgi:crossover junction endodeoxyribonuclease RuvC
MVARLLRLDAPPRPADAADALALALCHLWRAPLGAATAGAPAGASATSPRDRFDRAVSAALAREAGR